MDQVIVIAVLALLAFMLFGKNRMYEGFSSVYSNFRDTLGHNIPAKSMQSMTDRAASYRATHPGL